MNIRIENVQIPILLKYFDINKPKMGIIDNIVIVDIFLFYNDWFAIYNCLNDYCTRNVLYCNDVSYYKDYLSILINKNISVTSDKETENINIFDKGIRTVDFPKIDYTFYKDDIYSNDNVKMKLIGKMDLYANNIWNGYSRI